MPHSRPWKIVWLSFTPATILEVDFNCLRADVTGVHTSANMSGCKVADGEKAQGLNKAIHQLKPDANAKQATKDAEQQAKDDLKAIGG